MIQWSNLMLFLEHTLRTKLPWKQTFNIEPLYRFKVQQTMHKRHINYQSIYDAFLSVKTTKIKLTAKATQKIING